MIDPINFVNLNHCTPVTVISRTGCNYDIETSQYRVLIFGEDYLVALEKSKIHPIWVLSVSTCNRFNQRCDALGLP
jgi:hypothetical protein